MQCLVSSLIVRQEINQLLQLASSCVALLTIPELDPPEDGAGQKLGASPSSEASTPREPEPTSSRPRLPVGEERAEQFVLEATQYYETLDVRGATDTMPCLLTSALENTPEPADSNGLSATSTSRAGYNYCPSS